MFCQYSTDISANIQKTLRVDWFSQAGYRVLIDTYESVNYRQTVNNWVLIKMLIECRSSVICVSIKMLIECQSRCWLSVNQDVDWVSIEMFIECQSRCWMSVNQDVEWVSIKMLIECQSRCWLSVNQDVDGVSIKMSIECQSRCWSRVSWGYQTWQWMLLMWRRKYFYIAFI